MALRRLEKRWERSPTNSIHVMLMEGIVRGRLSGGADSQQR